MNNNGTVYLVGAGCGDAGWLTLRGAELLRTCQVLVYDDLLDGSLLALVPETAERIYVGKRAGHHSAPQAEINRILVEQARRGKTVVRLKGGDPFVFGRGGEEVQALQEAGIAFEVVPGITSAIAIPAAAGIPVTHRGASRSFHVITGHTANTADGLPEDMDRLATLSGTLVFLMGLGKLEAITQRLLAAGKAPETPAAVVSGGNSPHPATVRGTLANIAEKTRAAQVEAPAIIVVGEVAALELVSPKPLTGVRVAVTGTAAVQDKLLPALRGLGATALSAGRSRVVMRPDPYDMTTLGDGTERWLVFTSANGVHCFFRELRRQRVDLRTLHRCRFAVIGPATAKALADHGFAADLCPEASTSAALAEALCGAETMAERVLLFRSAEGSKLLPERLAARYQVEDIALYDMAWEDTAPIEKADYITFASSGGVTAYLRRYGQLPAGAVPVSIGPVTAETLARTVETPCLLAPEISTDGIVRAILEHNRGIKGRQNADTMA